MMFVFESSFAMTNARLRGFMNEIIVGVRRHDASNVSVDTGVQKIYSCSDSFDESAKEKRTQTTISINYWR
jgi:hypothetical protein